MADTTQMTAEELAEYGKTKVNLQEDTTWSSQPQEVKESAWDIIKQYNVDRGINSTTGQVEDPEAYKKFQSTLSETVEDYGIDPSTLSQEEITQLVPTIFTEDQMRELGLPEETIQQYFGLAGTAETAAQTLQGTTQPTNTSLKYLQNALQMVSGVGSQDIGTSKLYEAAGLAASVPTLSSDLSQRMEEMNAVYDKYQMSVGDIAGAQLDTYNLNRQKMDDALMQFQRLEDYMLGIDADARAMENELSLYSQKKTIDMQLAAQEPTKWGFDKALSEQFGVLTFVDEYGNFQFIDAEQSMAQGNMQVVDYSGAFADNCVEYIRTNYYDNLPVGMDSIEGREEFVTNYGFTLDTGSPQEGDIVVTNEGEWGHTAIIRGFTSDGNMILEEANYRSGTVTAGRELAVDSASIMGFWSPTRTVGSGTIGVKTGEGVSSGTEGVNPGGAETFMTDYVKYTDTSGKTGEGGYTAVNWLTDLASTQGYLTDTDIQSAETLLVTSKDKEIYNNWSVIQGGSELVVPTPTINDILTNTQFTEFTDPETGQLVGATDYYSQQIKNDTMTPTQVEQELYSYEGATESTVKNAMKIIGYYWDTEKRKWKKN